MNIKGYLFKNGIVLNETKLTIFIELLSEMNANLIVMDKK